MAVTAFQTNTESNLANMAGDLLTYLGATLDDDVNGNENAQFLVWCWVLVKAIKARQHAAPRATTGVGRDRVFELVGGHTSAAFMPLVSMIDDVYNEFYTVFNSVDQNLTNDDDEPWGTNILTRGTGPANGPIFGPAPTV